VLTECTTASDLARPRANRIQPGKIEQKITVIIESRTIWDTEPPEKENADCFRWPKLVPVSRSTWLACGINNSGEIVGESDSADQKRAFVYRKGQLVQLDTLAQNLNEAGFASLDVAYDINDKGWIVGYGTTSDNLTAAFVAVPERSGGSVKQQVPAPPPQVRKQKQLQPQDRDQVEAVFEPDEDDYDLFYSKLSPEGSWVEAGNYGYCFRPRVARDWQPYRDGHWVWTDRGWYWDSNERFGWATYHYGRWIRIGGTGWCWVPGDQWAPSLGLLAGK
jgi:probable HAF family extracellular repeat protein